MRVQVLQGGVALWLVVNISIVTFQQCSKSSPQILHSIHVKVFSRGEGVFTFAQQFFLLLPTIRPCIGSFCGLTSAVLFITTIIFRAWRSRCPWTSIGGGLLFLICTCLLPLFLIPKTFQQCSKPNALPSSFLNTSHVFSTCTTYIYVSMAIHGTYILLFAKKNSIS